ncbi:MAG: DUF488 domain-containing protein [Candidatus Aenigmarchaeota archaeon]|nr:DUF488 domain-containing protein [Candidatus Aenigmarchaeota archaeon]
MRIFTIGHSNRTMEDFLKILKAHEIKRVVDVRRFPGSKKFPHFNRENLEKVLPENDIGYFYLGERLGGFRKGGYKNYTKSGDFQKGIKKLLGIVRKNKTAVMCTELPFFRCHRRYVSDELVRLGHKVIHIFDDKRTYEHKLIEH